jgi:hypothetical protein
MIIPKRDHDKQAQFDRVTFFMSRAGHRRVGFNSRICAAQLFRAAKLIDASDAGPISA